MKIVCANELECDVQAQLSRIFVDGFYQWLQYFSKDKSKLTRTFAHMFNVDVFYVALVQDEIAGIAALCNGEVASVRLSKKEFCRHLGWIPGTMAYLILKREFEDNTYPFEINPQMGCVEFVATAPAFRGKGVASAIIRQFFSLAEYSEFVLEVADTNEKAVRLYETLGFKEFMRIEMKHKKRSGVNHLLYMRYAKE